MGKQSTREKQQNYLPALLKGRIYKSRASEKMDAVSALKIENLNMKARTTIYDILQMADAYKRPDLCNYYCSQMRRGQRYVPEVEVTNLSNIILETIASLNEINPLTGRLIQIARDGKISDDEIKILLISVKNLMRFSLAIDSLQIFADKTAGEQAQS